MLETELFRFLENTADAVFSVDRQGLIRSWNHSAEKLFGYPAHEVLDKPCGPLFQGRGPLGALICGETCTVRECVLARREVANYDMEVKKRSGHRVWINVSILLYHDDRTGRKLVIQSRPGRQPSQENGTFGSPGSRTVSTDIGLAAAKWSVAASSSAERAGEKDPPSARGRQRPWPCGRGTGHYDPNFAQPSSSRQPEASHA